AVRMVPARRPAAFFFQGVVGQIHPARPIRPIVFPLGFFEPGDGGMRMVLPAISKYRDGFTSADQAIPTRPRQLDHGLAAGYRKFQWWFLLLFGHDFLGTA